MGPTVKASVSVNPIWHVTVSVASACAGLDFMDRTVRRVKFLAYIRPVKFSYMHPLGLFWSVTSGLL